MQYIILLVVTMVTRIYVVYNITGCYYGYTQVVLLDEASQMSEPVSLLPIARFGCHKLLLLGDPKVNYSI